MKNTNPRNKSWFRNTTRSSHSGPDSRSQVSDKRTSARRLQPLVDLTAWKLLHKRTPYLARAVYHLLEAGESMSDVILAVRSSCTDRSLRPFLACAVYGCAHLRNVDRTSLFQDPLLDDPRGLVH